MKNYCANFHRFVFGLTALLPLLTSAVAVLVKEQRMGRGSSKDTTTTSTSILQLWQAVRQPNVFLPTLFIFLWQATPHSESAMFYFTYAHHHILYYIFTFCCAVQVVLRFS